MGCGLRKEIEGMLSLVRGKWKLRSRKLPAIVLSRHKYRYVIESVDRPFDDPAVAGYGGSKEAAMADLLENWRRGLGRARFPECPAGSREELRLKLAILGNGDGGTRS